MSRSFLGADGNRLVASEMGQPGPPGPPPARRRTDAPRLGEDGPPARRGGLARDRPRPARPWRQRVGGKRGLHLSGLRRRRDRGRPPDRRASTAAKPVAIGASLGGVASLLALADGRQPVFRGPRPRRCRAADGSARRRPHPGLHAGPRRGGVRLGGRGRRGGGGLSAASAAAVIPRRPEEEPPPPPGRTLALALGPALPRRPALGERGLGAGGRPASLRPRRRCRFRRFSCAAGRANSSRPRPPRSSFRSPPRSEYVDVAEARHMVAGDRNDAFANAILSFMRRHFSLPPRHCGTRRRCEPATPEIVSGSASRPRVTGGGAVQD